MVVSAKLVDLAKCAKIIKALRIPDGRFSSPGRMLLENAYTIDHSRLQACTNLMPMLRKARITGC
jgi:hypothetical protein